MTQFLRGQPANRGDTLSSDGTIVIFGAAVLRDGSASPILRSRVEAALRHGATLAQPMYLPTGAIGRHGPSEASVMAALLREAGVPAERIMLEESGTDTLSSVRAVCRLAPPGPIHVATSGFHMPRCVMLLRLAGRQAQKCPPPPAPADVTKRWYWRLRELPAIPYDLLLMLGLRMTGRL